MTILCTHPGKYGDCLWALATMRAISEAVNQDVDLLLSAQYGTEDFMTLLRQQYYVGNVYRAADWAIRETAPITPRVPPSLPEGYDAVVHLGYEGWPKFDLARETYRLAELQLLRHRLPPLDLDTPWIQECESDLRVDTGHYLAIGFSEEHFELKVGLTSLIGDPFLQNGAHAYVTNISQGPRWENWTWDVLERRPSSWTERASVLRHACLFVGCCSALHVLACGLGVPVILAEPAHARHHDCFYPFGKRSTRVQLVLGADGLPSVDSRHVREAIAARLSETEVVR
jgi:hypothetical protein